ncbi:MAG: D-alanyl-D-alanine carboxypeptidase [Ruminococcus sp.]|nr:D-alanyl-D-alanine carboxypeptidase [Ruminococcus sp.]
MKHSFTKSNIFRKLTALVMAAAVAVSAYGAALTGSAYNFTPTEYNDDGELEDIRLYSESVYMVNLTTGETIVDINSDVERAPASLTKIMTAIVMLDQIGSDERMLKETRVSAGTEAFDELYDTGASTADIQPYEDVSYYDLLGALLVPSACEASNIIAINVAGSIPEFVDLMNEKVEELGLEHTHFSNAHGLFTQQNYSTAHDMQIIAQYAYEHYTVFREIVNMEDFYMDPTDYHPDGTYLTNTNYMLSSYSDYYYPRCKGIKTGTTDASGRCLASIASDGDFDYMIVTMGAPMDKLPEDYAKGSEDPSSVYADDVIYYNLLDHIHLYNWAYSMLVSTDFINENSEITDIPVAYGKKLDYANLRPAESYSRMWPVSVPVDDVEQIITLKENVVAPVEIGDVLGTLELRYEGETLAKIDLISTTQVERSPIKTKTKVVKSYFRSNVFRTTALIIIAGVVIYGIVFFILIQRRYLRKKTKKKSS